MDCPWMGQIITDDALEPYIDDVLNELEVKLSRLPQSAPANGCSTFSLIQTHGELRASHGFPELSPVTHVQIGNEDHLWGGGPSYGERFTRFHDATKTPAHHHHQRPRVPSKPKPAGSGWTTTRTTRQMRWFKFNMFDNVDWALPYIVGEFAYTSLKGGERLPDHADLGRGGRVHDRYREEQRYRQDGCVPAAAGARRW